jgi:4-hydroxybenzoate polyprenyltransferase
VRGDITATPVLLAGAVTAWVAGFDVLYALQDLDFDRRTGLHSVPARFGEEAALWISAMLHLAMILLLALLPKIYPADLGPAYWVGVAGCLLLISYQHWIIRPGDLSRLDAAFFRANGLLAVWLFAATAFDLLVATP